MSARVDVVIPVYRPGRELNSLLQKLQCQTVRPRRILLVNTEKALFDESLLEGLDRTGLMVRHIRKEEFDHGGTRHMAASLLDGELLLFLTQDALPADSFLIEQLLHPFAQDRVCAAYARQLPRSDCGVLEQYTRSFNYPEESGIRTEEDLPQLGIKTFFCSNVCAMYRRSAYEELGGFERHTIFNEDMIFAAKLIQNHRAIAYCAQAKVIHSHNYSGLQQFRRNFDLGVSQTEHPEVFAAVRSESEGIRMVRKTAGHLLRIGKPWLLVPLVWISACKLAGYRLGKSWKKLPRFLVMRCTTNREYWKKEPQAGAEK